MRTESGVKDNVQEHFLDKLFASYKGKQGTQAKQAALDSAIQSLPSNITSAVWRLKSIFAFCNLSKPFSINVYYILKVSIHIKILQLRYFMLFSLDLSSISGAISSKTSSKIKTIKKIFLFNAFLALILLASTSHR